MVLYVIVTNASGTVVGKEVYNGGDPEALFTDKQARYPLLKFTSLDVNTFNNTLFVGPNYLFE